MAAYPESRPQKRKRQHAEADLFPDVDLPSLPSKKPPKRLKSTTKDHHFASNFPPAFWDALSKVWLTRRALRELDRRNQLDGVYPRAPAQSPTRKFSQRRDLRRFARRGGPELEDLRGYLGPTKVNSIYTMGSRRSSNDKSIKSMGDPSAETSNTEGSRKRSSAYNVDFEQHLIDHNIYMNNRKSKPTNINEIRQRLAQRRPSLSPSRFSEDAFEEFQQKNEDVISEPKVMNKVLPMIYGDTDIPNEENLLFTRLKSITNEATVDAQPDFYDGVRLESVDKQVRDDLSPYIIPTGHQKAPVAPNFFLEAKAPKGGADVVKRQVTHDLALGARGMHKLQSYGVDELVFDNKAYTLGATYHAGNLKMYATHVTSTGPGNPREYHTSQIGGWDTTGDRDTYLRGAAALRNGRDQAQEWRDELISAANERAMHLNAEPSTSSSYNGVSDTIEAYPVEESQTSDEIAAASFYLVEESHCNDLSNIIEGSEASLKERMLDTPVKPTPSKKRPSKGSEKTASKALRHSTGQKHRFKR